MEETLKAITVCVGYSDLLARTLPRMAKHFHQVFVVTSPKDQDTVLLANSFPNVCTHETEVFTRYGADFNKGAALEEGFDTMGRRGWICVLDADIVLPERPNLYGCEGYLYAPPRRLCRDPKTWDGTDVWWKYPLMRDKEWAGYFQLFHAADPVLRTRPWYPTDWRHAGGCDSEFQAKWPQERKRRLPFEVLHLGLPAQHWCGRSREGRQQMARYIRERMRTYSYAAEKLKPEEEITNGLGLL